ncbi:hypothetical protein CVT25_008538 [Psilocybe cyanescens]|uniref:Hydrophobin n=1 Tax=Psilocybe cyanescens TaxID=93625 RepID=A0A409X9U2_PSICY|nr:hypothetical protein CVT25_008538 [Psilocybe cyanescens]
MKFTFAIALFATAVATIQASPAPYPAPAPVAVDTNANRFARGLPPMRPMRRATPVAGTYKIIHQLPKMYNPNIPLGARRSSPSNVSGSCNTGSIQCCNSVQKADSGLVGLLEGLLGILIPIGTSIGQNCSPISAVGVGGNSCTQQPVCCDSNHFNGLINVGCSPSKESLHVYY